MALAYASAIGLSRAGANRQLVGLIDIVHRGERSLRPEKNSRRWEPLRTVRRTQAQCADHVRLAARAARRRGSGQVCTGTPSTERRASPGRDGRASLHFVPGDQRAVDTAEIARRRACQLSTAPTASSTTRSSSRPQSSTRRQRGEDVLGLEAVDLGGEHIQPLDERYIAKVGGPPGPARGLSRARRDAYGVRAPARRKAGHRLVAPTVSAGRGTRRRLAHLSRDDPPTAVGESSRLRGQ